MQYVASKNNTKMKYIIFIKGLVKFTHVTSFWLGDIRAKTNVMLYSLNKKIVIVVFLGGVTPPQWASFVVGGCRPEGKCGSTPTFFAVATIF